MKRTLLAALSLAAVVPAHAIFVDSGYAGGTQLVNNGVVVVPVTVGASLDDAYWTRTLAPGFDFYCTGTPLTTVHVSTNGLMSFGAATTDFSNSALNIGDTSTRYVAPLWDDWDMRVTTSPNAMAYVNDTANYFSFTGLNVRKFGAVAGDTGGDFQGLLIKNNVTLSGHNFLAGDIVFSYENIGGVSTNATVGVKWDNSTWTQAPGGNGFGLFDQAAANTLPTDNRFIRFRWTRNPTGGGTYVAAVVPEPGTMAALGLGALVLIRRRRNSK